MKPTKKRKPQQILAYLFPDLRRLEFVWAWADGRIRKLRGKKGRAA